MNGSSKVYLPTNVCQYPWKKGGKQNFYRLNNRYSQTVNGGLRNFRNVGGPMKVRCELVGLCMLATARTTLNFEFASEEQTNKTPSLVLEE